MPILEKALSNVMRKSLKKNNLYLRKATKKDMLFLYNIYNENVRKKNFFSKEKLKLTDHKIWFKKAIIKSLIFVCIKKYKIGYIRYDIFKNNHFKVSIAIKEIYKKRGFGRVLLEKSLKKINKKNFKVYAFIKKTNRVSKKFFLSCNFKLIRPNIYVLKYKNEKVYR